MLHAKRYQTFLLRGVCTFVAREKTITRDTSGPLYVKDLNRREDVSYIRCMNGGKTPEWHTNTYANVRGERQYCITVS